MRRTTDRYFDYCRLDTVIGTGLAFGSILGRILGVRLLFGSSVRYLWQGPTLTTLWTVGSPTSRLALAWKQALRMSCSKSRKTLGIIHTIAALCPYGEPVCRQVWRRGNQLIAGYAWTVVKGEEIVKRKVRGKALSYQRLYSMMLRFLIYKREWKHRNKGRI